MVFVWAALLVGATGVKATPVKTLVQDTFYRADGSVAHGTVTIRWSGFSTGAGEAVPAGVLTVPVDAQGKIEVSLIPNTGATPSGSYYKVVIKLDDGTTSEEQWVVPATTSTTVAAIRAKLVPQAVAVQFVSRDYVDSENAGVVHLSGAESIQGTKTFLSSPEVPPPADAGEAANKAYVDQEISGLAKVSATGNYSDLTNKPVLAAVATSGNYNDLANKPIIPNFDNPGPIGAASPSIVVGTTVAASSGFTGNLTGNVSGDLTGNVTGGTVAATTSVTSKTPVDVTHPNFGIPASCANAADPTGTNDSTCAINAAITYQQSPAIAGVEPVLHLPAGTYKVSEELRIPCTMHVKGDGENATVLKLTNNAAYAGVVITGYGSSGAQPGNLWTCNGSIEDLTIHAPDGHLFTGTLLENYNAGYRVRNVRLSNGGGRGLNLVGNAERMSVENLTVDTTRWPLVSFGNENHFWKTNISAPGTSDEGYYCYGANCVNGVGVNRQWSGTMTLQSATGNGATATYVVSCASAGSCPGGSTGQSPIVAGHWFTIAGVTDTTGLNGLFQAASVTNNSPSGQFTITAANTASGSGTVTSATFQPTILPETHAAAWLSGTDVEFNGGSIKALWNSDGINVTGGQAVTVQNMYLEGYPINGAPTLGANIVVNGLQDTTTLTATLTGTSCSGGSPCIASVADTSWSPVFISDPQDIGQIDYYTMRIAPQDFDPTISTQSAYAPTGVMRNMFETVLGGFTSGNKFYITSRNYTGSTAPENTQWPSGSYVLDDRTATFANQLTTINNHFNALNGAGNARWNTYCVDSEAVGSDAGSTTAHSCASIKVGTQPDGKMEFAPNSGNVNTAWGNAAMYATINDSFFTPKTETLGGNWIKAYTTGSQTDYIYIETNAAPQTQSGETTEVQTGQIQLGSSIPVQAIQNATGVASNVYVRNLTSGTSSLNNSQLGISWFENNITNPSFNDANLGSNPGYSGYAFGNQYTTSQCWYDTAESHALNRFCLKGSPDLTGTNAGFEYDTWSGTAWVKVAGVGGDGSMALPSATTATTQTPGDNSNKVATDAFVASAVALVSGGPVAKVAPATYSGTSGIGDTTLYTPVSAGLFRFCGQLYMTVAGTGGNFYLESRPVADGHTFYFTSPQISASGQWNQANACQTFYADANQAIKWNLTASSVTGSPTVRYSATLEQLE